MSYESAYKRLENSHEKFPDLKNVIPRLEANKTLKEKVLNDAWNLFNELYYIYKDKYNKEINSINTKDKENINYKNLRITEDYKYNSEDEEEQQTSKNFNKLKKQT